ncbi:hypothetical protein JTB14_028704 [Gonioctena quinquepunctata]|nr:hypothetical protein JTB14_028704 [Gonioctena quinquepunctata]
MQNSAENICEENPRESKPSPTHFGAATPEYQSPLRLISGKVQILTPWVQNIFLLLI